MSLPVTLIALMVAALLQPVHSQTSCGGNPYVPGSVSFTRDCYDAIQACTAQFAANASLVDCSGAVGAISMQQEANLDGEPGSQNNNVVVAFQDIRDLCVLSGHTSGTWGFSDDQWYWINAGDGCYTNATGEDVLPTHEAPYCVQNRDSTLPDCYPQPKPSGGQLKVIKVSKTSNGFSHSARGWNTFAIQALRNGTEVVPSFGDSVGLDYTQEFVQAQCGELAHPRFRTAGFEYCSLDSGWQQRKGADEHGRITYNETRFNMPELGRWLHDRGVKLGLYVTPGVPCEAENRTVKGADYTIGSLWNGNNDQLFCDFDFSKDGVQHWHDTVVELWASWGVDMIKLDYLTPGSPQNGANLDCDNSDAVRAYRKAIQKTGRDIRLDLSWKLCRNDTWLPTWSGLADSMRTDQDINNYGGDTFLEWNVAQRAIDNYRQYILLQAQRDEPITIYPDMDNLFAGNREKLTGVNDSMRTTVMNHWLGAGANLILGSDLTTIDDLGWKLLTSGESIAAAEFFATYPMQPRNPGTGDNLAKQLQAWIAGPSDASGDAYLLLANLGPDLGQGGFDTALYGPQGITVSLEDLGIAGTAWRATDVWGGNSTTFEDSHTAWLTEGASQLLHLRNTASS